MNPLREYTADTRTERAPRWDDPILFSDIPQIERPIPQTIAYTEYVSPATIRQHNARVADKTRTLARAALELANFHGSEGNTVAAAHWRLRAERLYQAADRVAACPDLTDMEDQIA